MFSVKGHLISILGFVDHSLWPNYSTLSFYGNSHGKKANESEPLFPSLSALHIGAGQDSSQDHGVLTLFMSVFAFNCLRKITVKNFEMNVSYILFLFHG
jgi:hypothetical protein